MTVGSPLLEYGRAHGDLRGQRHAPAHVRRPLRLSGHAEYSPERPKVLANTAEQCRSCQGAYFIPAEVAWGKSSTNIHLSQIPPPPPACHLLHKSTGLKKHFPPVPMKLQWKGPLYVLAHGLGHIRSEQVTHVRDLNKTRPLCDTFNKTASSAIRCIETSLLGRTNVVQCIKPTAQIFLSPAVDCKSGLRGSGSANRRLNCEGRKLQITSQVAWRDHRLNRE